MNPDRRILYSWTDQHRTVTLSQGEQDHAEHGGTPEPFLLLTVQEPGRIIPVRVTREQWAELCAAGPRQEGSTRTRDDREWIISREHGPVPNAIVTGPVIVGERVVPKSELSRVEAERGKAFLVALLESEMRGRSEYVDEINGLAAERDALRHALARIREGDLTRPQCLAVAGGALSRPREKP